MTCIWKYGKWMAPPKHKQKKNMKKKREKWNSLILPLRTLPVAPVQMPSGDIVNSATIANKQRPQVGAQAREHEQTSEENN